MDNYRERASHSYYFHHFQKQINREIFTEKDAEIQKLEGFACVQSLPAMLNLGATNATFPMFYLFSDCSLYVDQSLYAKIIFSHSYIVLN